MPTDPKAIQMAHKLQQLTTNLQSTIILFGSRARGDHRVDSDYDLLIHITDTPDSIIHATAAANILANQYPNDEIDFSLVIGDISPIHQTPNDNPNNPLPNAIAFTNNPEQLTQLGMYPTIPLHKPNNAIPCHFMVSSLMVYKLTKPYTTLLEHLDQHPPKTKPNHPKGVL